MQAESEMLTVTRWVRMEAGIRKCYLYR